MSDGLKVNTHGDGAFDPSWTILRDGGLSGPAEASDRVLPNNARRGGARTPDRGDDGEHRFQLEPLGPERTRFIQSERFSGVLVALSGGALTKTERGFEQMNDAPKRRVEGR
jgi:hypothetical protein